MLLIAAIIGGVLNMARGGVFARWLGSFGKPLNHLSYGLLILTMGYSWYLALAGALLAWVTFSFGWGRYVGALIEQKVRHDETEIKWIDRAIEAHEGNWLKFGVYGLTLRGLIIGVPFAILLSNPYLVLSGASMGLCYALAAFMCRKIDKLKYAWAAGEFIFGAVIWFTIYAGV